MGTISLLQVQQNLAKFAGSELAESTMSDSEEADDLLLAAYNVSDAALREEGFAHDWEFARERARRAALLRAGGHWERMSSSLHLNYDFNGAGLPLSSTRWIYMDFISSRVAKHEYWATMVHRLGYVGYQSKVDGSGKKYSQFQCSNWDSKGHDVQATSTMKYCGPGVTCKRFGHEGSGWQTHIQNYDIVPADGKRFAFAISFQPAGGNNIEVTCYFLAPGFNQNKWFKQAVWVGPGGKPDGTHASSFLEQYSFEASETAKIREGLYGSVCGELTAGIGRL
jgi:hypothetical protein